MAESPVAPAEDLRRLLLVEELDTDLFRGAACAESPGRVFGGQVIAQALAAAGRSVRETLCAHSLHAYFLRAGDTVRPIIYRVLRDFDGGSFANRRVVAMQGGLPILNLAASFQRVEDGLAHAAEMPEALPPEQCVDLVSALKASGAPLPPALRDRLAAFDLRIGPSATGATGPASQYAWLRLSGAIEPEPVLRRVLLAYASDFALLTTAVLPHPVKFFSPRLQGASLDHAIWFHETPPVEDWLLYAMESPWAGHARGFARGQIFDRAGRLVASIAQEGLIRLREKG